MRVPVLVLLVILSLGCLIEGGPGRDEYVPYEMDELMEDPGSHRSEWVELIGEIVENPECGGYKIGGTNIELSGELDPYIGTTGIIKGVFQTRITDIECGGLRIDVDEFEPEKSGEIVTS